MKMQNITKWRFQYGCMDVWMYACMYACMHVLFEHVFESNAGMLKCMNAASCHVMKGCDFFAKGFEL